MAPANHALAPPLPTGNNHPPKEKQLGLESKPLHLSGTLHYFKNYYFIHSLHKELTKAN